MKETVAMKEKVSIILPTYNRAHILRDAVDSVLNQTYSEFELLIIDDASTDHTKELIQSYKDDRMIYYPLKENGGVSAARNYGMKQARFDYIAFEDSDDIWHADKLEKQMEALVHTDDTVGFCYHKIGYDLGDQYVIVPSESVPLKDKSGDIYRRLLYDNLVGCPTMLVKRACMMQTTGFDTQMKALEDYEFVLQMAKQKKAVFVDEVLLEASYSTTGISGSAVNKLLASCYILMKYKQDYKKTGILKDRLRIILYKAEEIGMYDQIEELLERIMRL